MTASHPVSPPLMGEGHDASEDGRGRKAFAFTRKDSGQDAGEEAPTLRAMGHDQSHANGGGQLAIAEGAAVRRLTPTECERLMGMEDGHTCLCGVQPYSTWACVCPDGPRYAACGNSVVVPVVEWLGRRLLAVHRA